MKFFRKLFVKYSLIILTLIFLSAFSTGAVEKVPGQVQKKSVLTFIHASDGLPMTGMWKSNPAFADVNSDGFLDLSAISRNGDGAHVWLGNGKGKWINSSKGLKLENSCGGGVAFGDINKDNFLDLAVADHCQGVFVYLGDGKGNWKRVTQELNPRMANVQPSDKSKGENELFKGAEDIAIGDVNEDSFLDLVVASSDQGGLSVYFGDGTGVSWKESSSDGLPSSDDPETSDGENAGWANQVLLYDMDSDGHLDVAAAYYTGPRVWKGNGKGQWQNSSQGLPSPIFGGLFRKIAVGDINKDGLNDIAVANFANGPEAFIQNKNGSWQPAKDVLPSIKGGAEGIDLADMDKDGNLDIVFLGRKTRDDDSTFGIFISKGNGKGGWSEAEKTNLPDSGFPKAWGVTTSDVNGDGLIDLAITSDGFQKKAEVIDTKESKKSKSVFPSMQVWLNHHKK